MTMIMTEGDEDESFSCSTITSEEEKQQMILDEEEEEEEEEDQLMKEEEEEQDKSNLNFFPKTADEERQIVEELTRIAESISKQGNPYYILSKRWFMDWQRYTGQDVGDYHFDQHYNGSQQSDWPLVEEKYRRNWPLVEEIRRPGRIDNSHLIVKGSNGTGDDLEMDTKMEEGRDYVLVPTEVWNKLYYWYKGGPALPRKLISQGGEDFPLENLHLNLISSGDSKRSTVEISKKASVRELYEKICTLLKLDPRKVHIWEYDQIKDERSFLPVSNQTLEEVKLHMNQDILWEVQLDGCQSNFGMEIELALVASEPISSAVTIVEGPTLCNGYSTQNGNNSSHHTFSSPATAVEDEHDILGTMNEGPGRGLMGLTNLGNTCFMNSAIQCLVHTPPLVDYFLQDYSSDINKQNPLGKHGELANEFGQLLRILWSSRGIPFPPHAFKRKLAQFAPQFNGNDQHDSHELLVFLLDGLHEDLNRVKDKPYVERKDADGRSDEEVASEYWENHKARNDSVIVDFFQGQDKSALVCPDCRNVSVTFDPFMYLSLPLPAIVTRAMTVTVIYGDGSAPPTSYTVTVLKRGCHKDLIQSLSAACCLRNDEDLLLAEIFDNDIYKFLKPSEPLSTILDTDYIVAYILPRKQEDSFDLMIVPGTRKIWSFYNGAIRRPGWKPCAIPVLTCLHHPNSEADVPPAACMVLKPFLKNKAGSNQDDCASGREIGTPVNQCDFPPALREQAMENLEDMEFRWFQPRQFIGFSLIRSGNFTGVQLNMSERECDLYDLSCLNNFPQVHKVEFTVNRTPKEEISLYSCLETFLKEEPLGLDDMWYCSTCKEHRQATKKLDLWRLPEILVFQLKRFSSDGYLNEKLNTFVNFPIRDLDLSKYVKSKDSAKSHIYDLYAIINHWGNLGGGHYTTYAKVEEDSWYHFDDTKVQLVPEREIKTPEAYVLFYRRTAIEPEETLGESSQVHSSSCSQSCDDSLSVSSVGSTATFSIE